jgi:hypothetical protein
VIYSPLSKVRRLLRDYRNGASLNTKKTVLFAAELKPWSSN